MRLIRKANVSIKVDDRHLELDIKQFSKYLVNGILAEMLGLVKYGTYIIKPIGKTTISLTSMNKEITEDVIDYVIEWESVEELQNKLVKLSSIFLKDIKSSDIKSRYESAFFDGKGICFGIRETPEGVAPYQVPLYHHVYDGINIPDVVQESVLGLLNDKFMFQFYVVSNGKRLEIEEFESDLAEGFKKMLNDYLTRVYEIYSGNVDICILCGNNEYSFIDMHSTLRQGKELKSLGISFIESIQKTFINELITKNLFYCTENDE
ncbi:hypothetical protein BPT24_253 [Tenacibaculum phage pT24]|uniref:Uncharacterized protein n=1 Tax=Tenacibaculum phage pT24 TaxID=1880590 RepID=A0A1B4XX31_9CAUD|nr:hypothetical protein HYP10_gp275 [Tenacibaculum phage pT24]BAV39372.1 hypothetical protein BPT24_253 [Tenacibaculum phage pT24]